MAKEPKPKKCRALCGGCYHEDYWYGLGGAKECWSFKSAKIVKRLTIDIVAMRSYPWTEAGFDPDKSFMTFRNHGKLN